MEHTDDHEIGQVNFGVMYECQEPGCRYLDTEWEIPLGSRGPAPGCGARHHIRGDWVCDLTPGHYPGEQHGFMVGVWERWG